MVHPTLSPSEKRLLGSMLALYSALDEKQKEELNKQVKNHASREEKKVLLAKLKRKLSRSSVFQWLWLDDEEEEKRRLERLLKIISFHVATNEASLDPVETSKKQIEQLLYFDHFYYLCELYRDLAQLQAEMEACYNELESLTGFDRATIDRILDQIERDEQELLRQANLNEELRRFERTISIKLSDREKSVFQSLHSCGYHFSDNPDDFHLAFRVAVRIDRVKQQSNKKEQKIAEALKLKASSGMPKQARDFQDFKDNFDLLYQRSLTNPRVQFFAKEKNLSKAQQAAAQKVVEMGMDLRQDRTMAFIEGLVGSINARSSEPPSVLQAEKQPKQKAEKQPPDYVAKVGQILDKKMVVDKPEPVLSNALNKENILPFESHQVPSVPNSPMVPSKLLNTVEKSLIEKRIDVVTSGSEFVERGNKTLVSKRVKKKGGKKVIKPRDASIQAAINTWKGGEVAEHKSCCNRVIKPQTKAKDFLSNK